MSGLPGKSDRLMLYLRPRRQSVRRSSISQAFPVLTLEARAALE
jgi:hypothetical protein